MLTFNTLYHSRLYSHPLPALLVCSVELDVFSVVFGMFRTKDPERVRIVSQRQTYSHSITTVTTDTNYGLVLSGIGTISSVYQQFVTLPC